jgi:hypothetical protein
MKGGFEHLNDGDDVGRGWSGGWLACRFPLSATSRGGTSNTRERVGKLT